MAVPVYRYGDPLPAKDGPVRSPVRLPIRQPVKLPQPSTQPEGE